ncbi:MAG: hypothetical protein AB8H80_18480 [Planctomycetota bacterium]
MLHTQPRTGLQTLPALAALLIAGAATAQSQLTAPATHAGSDAVSFNWIAGADAEVRQQTLVGASHLQPLAGQSIHAIELRRNANSETFAGGTCHMTVTLSIAPHAPVSCSSTFANNVGSQPIQVFDGNVTIPTSPPSGPTAGWTPTNTVRIPLTTPYAYTGGVLCVDVVGTPIAGQHASWWMADASFEDIAGQTVDLGGGCGTYGGPSSSWSYVAPRSLTPGGYVQMIAHGQPGGLAFAMIGPGMATGTPLQALGFPAPSSCSLQLGAIDLMLPTTFVPDPEPMLVHRGGLATVELNVPAIPQALGFSMATQWFDWSQGVTSNAIEWTLAASIPSLDMALVEGHPDDAKGNATNFIAHVMRFEYQ